MKGVPLVYVIVAVDPIDRATFPVPRVASPIFRVEVLLPKMRVAPFSTVRERQRATTPETIVTVTPLGIVTLSAAVVATPPKDVFSPAV
jgi:hypothetical protein